MEQAIRPSRILIKKAKSAITVADRTQYAIAGQVQGMNRFFHSYLPASAKFLAIFERHVHFGK